MNDVTGTKQHHSRNALFRAVARCLSPSFAEMFALLAEYTLLMISSTKSENFIFFRVTMSVIESAFLKACDHSAKSDQLINLEILSWYKGDGHGMNLFLEISVPRPICWLENLRSLTVIIVTLSQIVIHVIIIITIIYLIPW